MPRILENLEPSRISQLPRRNWEDPARAEEIVKSLTSILRTRAGTQTLFPLQAVSLFEAFEQGGLFCAAQVGAGKTLTSGLLPKVLGAVRPLLVVPGSLVEATRRAYSELSLHWQIPAQAIRIESYTKLGLEKYASLLEAYQPDLIVFDEAHRLKNVQTCAAARRVSRYLEAHPKTKVCILTGTVSKASITDYAHMLIWALRDKAPVPQDKDRIEFWAACLDHKPAEDRPDSSALSHEIGGPCRTLQEARETYRDRLRATPGCVISSSAYADAGLSIRPIDLQIPEALRGAFEDLRATFTAPDGWLLLDERFEVWHLARQLALGFYYRHDPRPPEPWYMARRAWGKFVREVIEVSSTFDSEQQVYNACERGELPRHAFDPWIEIRDTFVPNTVCEFLSTHALEAVEAWARGPGKDGGIVWVDHVEFGAELAKRNGWTFYKERGLSAAGAYIGDAKATDLLVASRFACSTGHNLQKWCRNLVTAPPNGGGDWEQMIGRTHRTGQKADCVYFWYLNACLENWRSVENALAESRYVEQTTGAQQRLGLADLVMGSVGSGPAWGVISKRNEE